MRLILSLVFALGAFAEPTIVTKTVELDWEPVEKASGYEVRLTPVSGGKAEIIKTSESHLSKELPLGNYNLQIRSRAKVDDALSPWSETSFLEVAVKEIIPLNPVDNATIDANGSGKQTVDFKWSPVEKVKIYTLRVWTDSKKDTPWVFTGVNTGKQLAVPTGQVYHWQVLFESANQTEYSQEPKTFSFIIQGSRLLPPELPKLIGSSPKVILWDAQGAETFGSKLYYRHLDEKEWTFVSEKGLSSPEWHPEKLAPGAYKLEVVSKAPRHLDSEPASCEFLVKPSEPELAQELSKFSSQ